MEHLPIQSPIQSASAKIMQAWRWLLAMVIAGVFTATALVPANATENRR